MATKTKRTRRPKQTFIPGAEPPSFPDIDRAAEKYVDLRDQRMALMTPEADAALDLAALLKEHNLSVYEYDGKIVRLDSVTKAKVKKKKAAGDNGDGEGE